MEWHKNVCEIQLEHGLGYGYILIAITKNYKPTKIKSNYLVAYPLRIRNTSPMEKNNLIQFEKVKFLRHPILMSTKPRLRGEGKWRQIGFLDSIDIENLIPDFAFPSTSLIDAKHPSKVDNWYLVENFNVTDSYSNPTSYDKISHIGYWMHHDYVSVTRMITIEWMKVEGIDVLDYYDISDERGKNALCYYYTYHLPIYKDIQLKVL